MTEHELNAILMDAFPELKEELTLYMEEDGDGMDTGCFLTHEDVLHPFIDQAFKDEDQQILKRVGAYVERLLNLNDEYAENVAIIGIVEWIALDRPALASLIPFGPKAQAAISEYRAEGNAQ